MKNLFIAVIGTLVISSSSFAISPIKKIEPIKETVSIVKVSNEKLDKISSNKIVTVILDNNENILPAPKSIICWIAWVFNSYCIG